MAKVALSLIFSLAVGMPPALARPAPPVPDAEAVATPGGALVIPIYGKANPGSPADEITSIFMGQETVVRNITYPTLTAVFPKPEKANGTAVVLLPGGGFGVLALQDEGWRLARKFADSGVTAFVLKYRLLKTPRSPEDFDRSSREIARAIGNSPGKVAQLKDPAATQDAIAALKLIRARAAEWHVNPQRVGMIGFSAGAMTTMNVTLSPPGADRNARGPDFIGYVYGPMGPVAVPADAPPMFAALAMDDPLFGNTGWEIASAWHAAKRPVELHVYQTGGHGFGLGRPGTTTTLILDEFLAWMDMQGLLKPAAP